MKIKVIIFILFATALTTLFSIPAKADPKRADLHVHTIYSDGVLTPAEVVKLAKKSNVSIIAIADHDSIAGIDEAIKTGEALGIEIVPGIEFGAYALNTEVHILGFYIDYQNTEFIKELERLKTFRIKRIEAMIKKLNKAGFDITIEEVLKEASSGKNVAPEKLSIGRSHLSKVMAKKKICKNEQDAMKNFIGLGNPYYVDVMNNLSPTDAVALIRKYKGIPVVAHPGLIKQSGLVEKLAQNGLLGIEAFYPQHSAQQIDEFKKLAKRYNLILTGGSDFHMPPGIIGYPAVSEETLSELKKIKSTKKSDKQD